ncbi:chemotaxis protein CheX [Sinanaerobacter chloroacetimidivorans]|jgi:chemotaxis protein CheX|uniref:Chemotaxis protein CheX n=1 Tax=Sinanaerobacter chloroacetimidivorans TaxID=2818044 RepID=A0A8J8B1B7_9FIRM|nr:chemotaxis protein CheX [Sinanaerobacter chloroacetimidivorans]MBR0597491.1 chemotaxis protein CheX [Sinanaerobacter chloroacetimidivorans]
MSQNILAPFSKAACQTFKLLLDIDVMEDTPEAFSENSQGNVEIAIGIIGDYSGEILYCFPKDTTLEIVKTMCGMEFDEIDEFVKSAIGELANIISGNALTDLSQQKVICDILPPKFMEGNNSDKESSQCPVYQTRMKTPIGNVELRLKVDTSNN